MNLELNLMTAYDWVQCFLFRGTLAGLGIPADGRFNWVGYTCCWEVAVENSLVVGSSLAVSSPEGWHILCRW